MKVAAIVLAGGSGKRMGTDVKKQYLQIGGEAVLMYSLKRMQKQAFITDIILVTSEDEIDYCRENFIIPGKIEKCRIITAGGRERSDSVMNGLSCCTGSDYVFIHDGARPFVSDELMERLYEDVRCHGACIAAVPVKDTIKVTENGTDITSTPKRSMLWQAQTPQVFACDLIFDAYRKAMAAKDCSVTDDASCVELFTDHKVRLTMGSYDNIKITTPEDLAVADRLSALYRD